MSGYGAEIWADLARRQREEVMEWAGALETARQIAAQMDLPAWVWRDPATGKYQVACMDWTSLTPMQRTEVQGVVLPDGMELAI